MSDQRSTGTRRGRLVTAGVAAASIGALGGVAAAAQSHSTAPATGSTATGSQTGATGGVVVQPASAGSTHATSSGS